MITYVARLRDSSPIWGERVTDILRMSHTVDGEQISEERFRQHCKSLGIIAWDWIEKAFTVRPKYELVRVNEDGSIVRIG